MSPYEAWPAARLSETIGDLWPPRRSKWARARRRLAPERSAQIARRRGKADTVTLLSTGPRQGSTGGSVVRTPYRPGGRLARSERGTRGIHPDMIHASTFKKVSRRFVKR